MAARNTRMPIIERGAPGESAPLFYPDAHALEGAKGRLMMVYGLELGKGRVRR